MAEIQFCELIGHTARLWGRLDSKDRERLLANWADKVTRIDANRIHFKANAFLDENKTVVKAFEKDIFKIISDATQGETIRDVAINYHKKEDSFSNFVSQQKEFENRFRSLSFGGDVAERDADLMSYFLETPAYQRVASFQKGIVVGPKGSGKSSILLALASEKSRSPRGLVKITPEVFATNILKQIISKDGHTDQESRAITTTWEFSIIVEVLKLIKLDPRNVSRPALAEIDNFRVAHSNFVKEDIFTRFISFIKSFKMKFEDLEIDGSVPSREARELYSLESLYNLILKIRDNVKREFIVLVDELDQGWDNSVQSNAFIAGLVEASAVKLQNIGLNLHVVVFVRAEIFNLVRSRLAQLDKIRSSIEVIRWSDAELEKLIHKRIAYHFGHSFARFESKPVLDHFFDTVSRIPGYRFIISRTTMRPREVLQFVKLAHQFSVESGINYISADAITRASEEFSRWKLEHLIAEYMHIYPQLEGLLRSFRGCQFVIARDDMEVSILKYIETEASGEWAGVADFDKFIEILYQIEFIGVEKASSCASELNARENFDYFFEFPAANVKNCSRFAIHPAFWRALEIIGSG